MDDIKIDPANPAPDEQPVATFSLGGADDHTPPAGDQPAVALPVILEPALLEPSVEIAQVPGLIETSQSPEQTAAVATEQIPQQEALPPPSPELVEAATGIPMPEPEEQPGMNKKKKIGLIVAGILIVVIAAGALLYFSGGGPFKGQVMPPDETRFSAVELCPTDYYAPKSAAMIPAAELDLSVAKAQLLPFTPKGINAVETTKETVDFIKTNTDASIKTINPTTGDAESEQPGISSETATLEQEGSGLSLQTDTPDMEGISIAGTVPAIPEGCYPIPHDNLSAGNDQCGLIEQLYLDPSGYRLNEETKANLEGWHMKCTPPPVDTTVLCGENQETGPIGAAPTCVCKEGYFDVGFALPEGMGGAFIADPTRATDNFLTTTSLSCWNCEKLLAETDTYKKQLESATTLDEQAILEKRIKDLEDVAVRNDCKKPEETKPSCGVKEYRDASGACVCEDHYKKSPAAVADICIYDCDFVSKKIIDLRKSATTISDNQVMSDLVALEKEALENGCDVPKEQTECERYLEESNNFFNDANYDRFYDQSNLYIDANCSGKTPTDCEKTLAKGVSTNRILDTIGATAATTKYKEEILRLKNDYYANSTCNKTSDRCAQLSALFEGAPAAPADLRIDQPINDAILTAPATVGLKTLTSWDVVTPSNVFKDDREYYDKYCKVKELSCTEVRESLTPAKLMMLDIGSDLRVKYEACFTVPDDNATRAPTPGTAPTPNVTMPPPAPTPTPTQAETQVTKAETASVPPPVKPAATTPPPADKIVETETASIPSPQVSAPVPPVDEPVVEKVTTLKPAAPETTPTPVYEEVPPEITPTGPETYIYLAGILLGQIYYFRRRIYARLSK